MELLYNQIRTQLTFEAVRAWMMRSRPGPFTNLAVLGSVFNVFEFLHKIVTLIEKQL